MVDLIASDPWAQDLSLPLTHGTTRLDAVPQEGLWSLQPYRGAAEAVSELFELNHGVSLPCSGDTCRLSGGRLLWFGRGSYMCIGAEPPEKAYELSAITDQSDAWCRLVLSGEECQAVLALCVPVDLRLSHFAVDRTCRTMLGHLNVSITRVSEMSFEIMGFRSMAQTLAHDLATAMQHVAVRTG